VCCGQEGEEAAGDSNFSVSGLQAAQLHDDEEQEEASGQIRVEEILSVLQEAHTP